MSKTIGQFDFTVTKWSKGDPLPFDPFLVINLKHWGQTAADGAPVVSANLMTAAEIDAHIAYLKADLDRVGLAAKQALQRARDATMSAVGKQTDD